MKSKNTLYLGSQSSMRQKLLDSARIPYIILQHNSDEAMCNTTGSFHEQILIIAQSKMKHLILPSPEAVKTKEIFVLTADTLMRMQSDKQILGKPIDREDAKRMLRILRTGPIELVTGCCLERKRLSDNVWQTDDKRYWTTDATLTFCVPDKDMNTYLDLTPHALHACGAGVVEDYGLNFFKSMTGSFSGILGLPLFELQEALDELGF